MMLCYTVDSSLEVGAGHYRLFRPLQTGVQAFPAGQTTNIVVTCTLELTAQKVASIFLKDARLLSERNDDYHSFLRGLSPAKLHTILLSILNDGNPRVHFNDIQTLFLVLSNHFWSIHSTVS